MPLLSINLGAAPDVQPKITPGVRRMKVNGVPELKPANTGNGTVLHVKLVCVDDGPDHGITMMDYISTQMETRIKRFALSCGVERSVVESPAGFDTDLTDGKVCLCVVGSSTYTDKQTNFTRDKNQLNEYLIPGDQGYPTAEGSVATGQQPAAQ